MNIFKEIKFKNKYKWKLYFLSVLQRLTLENLLQKSVLGRALSSGDDEVVIRKLEFKQCITTGKSQQK